MPSASAQSVVTTMSAPAPRKSAVALTSIRTPASAMDSGEMPNPMSITSPMTRPSIARSTRAWSHDTATMLV